MTITLSHFEESLEDANFPLAVAVSGGPDSLALLLLAHELAQQKGSHVIALTVDHGLRPESQKEANHVGKWVKARGIEHVILEWAHDHPTSRLQEKARHARYELLTEWCKCHQISTLLLGHHQQDQEETFWLRLTSGSGLDGLTGMKKRLIRNGITLLRPLLNFPKDRIKKTLQAQNQEWIEDPSNQNPRFFRGNLRNFLHEEGLTSSRLYNVMEKLRVDADFIQDSLRQAVEATVQVHEGGYLTIKKQAFNGFHPAIAKRVLSLLMQWFSGAEYGPRSIQVARIVDKIKKESFFTAGGICWVFSGGDLYLFREIRAIREKVVLSQLQEPILWDQRFWIDPGLKDYFSSETIFAPLGVPGLSTPSLRAPTGGVAIQEQHPDCLKMFLKSKTGLLRPALCRTRNDDADIIPKRAWPTLPALWLKGKVVAIPHLCYNSLTCEKDLRKFFSLKPLFHDSLRITI